MQRETSEAGLHTSYALETERAPLNIRASSGAGEASAFLSHSVLLSVTKVAWLFSESKYIAQYLGCRSSRFHPNDIGQQWQTVISEA